MVFHCEYDFYLYINLFNCECDFLYINLFNYKCDFYVITTIENIFPLDFVNVNFIFQLISSESFLCTVIVVRKDVRRKY